MRDRSASLFALPIVLSAILLFLVQPLLAKQILPWFGGSASVWNTCLFFFQFMLLAGYCYAWLLDTALSPRTQAIVHAALIMAAVATLPVIASDAWKTGDGDPALRILLLLSATVGLPYFILSSTSPLLQAWYARKFAAPYRLFALSNAASLAGLLAYPFLIEPLIDVRRQAVLWSIGFVAFGIACTIAAMAQARGGGSARVQELKTQGAAPAPMLWLTLSALGSLALASTTSFIAANIASMPLIWVVPLAIYLVTFIVAFADWRLPRSGISMAALFFALGMAATLRNTDFVSELYASLPVYLGGLFALCLYCHGELATAKPAPARLTLFYILVSLGGAIGALCSSILAPLLLNGDFELPLTLAAISAVVAMRSGRTAGDMRVGMRAVSSVLAIAVGAVVIYQIGSEVSQARVLVRNFYSSLRIIDTGEGSALVRRMEHGGVEHGAQYLAPEKRTQPISYYGPSSGAALAIAAMRKQRQAALRIGVVGLGAGALAAYGESDGTVRFYEINPQVIDLAKSQFTYMSDSKAAIEIATGDARLLLEAEPAQNFDVLAIDAFSGGAIPIHLLTREALAIYRRHLRPGGALLFHISNKFVDLEPALARLMHDAGLHARVIADYPDELDETSPLSSSNWVIVSEDKSLYTVADLLGAEELEEPQAAPAWTDDANTILSTIVLPGSND
jgi:spermidine synthase